MRATPVRSCLLFAFGAAVVAQTPAPPSPLVERVGDTAFIQLQADSFRQLDARHQALAYWLTQAAMAIDPIIYDQRSAYGVREKRRLEGIMREPESVPPATRARIRSYA